MKALVFSEKGSLKKVFHLGHFKIFWAWPEMKWTHKVFNGPFYYAIRFGRLSLEWWK